MEKKLKKPTKTIAVIQLIQYDALTFIIAL